MRRSLGCRGRCSSNCLLRFIKCYHKSRNIYTCSTDWSPPVCHICRHDWWSYSATMSLYPQNRLHNIIKHGIQSGIMSASSPVGTRFNLSLDISYPKTFISFFCFFVIFLFLQVSCGVAAQSLLLYFLFQLLFINESIIQSKLYCLSE